MSRKIAFMVHGQLRNRNSVMKSIETAFEGETFQFFLSQRKGHTEEQASEAVLSGFNHLIAVGGDGTLNDTINGIFKAFLPKDNLSAEQIDFPAAAAIKAGILPSGTGNDFARFLGLNADPYALRQLIQNERSCLLDIGLAKYTGHDGQPSERFYMNITDTGMGGEVVKKLENRISWLSNQAQYHWAIIRTFLTYNKVPARCTGPGLDWSGKVMNLVLANGKFFASGLGIAPEAKLNDGKMNLVILGDITILDYLLNLSKVKRSEKIDHPQVHYASLEEVEVIPLEGSSLAIDMDGDFIGYAPLKVKIIPRVLHFIGQIPA